LKKDYYSLEVDEGKNRIYFSLFGEIPSVDAIPDFESDWMSTVAPFKNGFTILANLKEMKPLPSDVSELNQKVQVKLMQQGCKKVAQVASIDIVVQVNKMAVESGLKDILRGFSLARTAEMWLDK